MKSLPKIAAYNGHKSGFKYVNQSLTDYFAFSFENFNVLDHFHKIYC